MAVLHLSLRSLSMHSHAPISHVPIRSTEYV